MSEKKPIVLIFTSHDELGNCSKTIANAIEQLGTHHVVIISDDKYAQYGQSKTKFALKDKALSFYEAYLERKKSGANKGKGRRINKRIQRIKNAVLRFNPTCIVCTTTIAQVLVCEAKEKTKFTAPIISVANSFSVKKNTINEQINAYIVDNQEQKQALTKLGVIPKDVMVMGLPFKAEERTPLEVEALKQDLGIPKTTTILVDFKGQKIAEEIVNLLIDQGRICNIIVFAPSTQAPIIRKIIDAKEVTNTQIVTDYEELDKYLVVSDLIVTDLDASIIYKGFELGKPLICYDPSEDEELSYLLSKGLIIKANEPIDIVDGVYSILQSNKKEILTTAGQKWIEFADINNIASYIAAYINTDD